MPIRRLYSDWTTELAIDVSLAQQSGHIGGAPWQTHRGASLSLRAEVERPLRMRGSAGALMERHASLRATGRSRFSLRTAHCIVHDIYRLRCRKAPRSTHDRSLLWNQGIHALFSLMQRRCV